MPAKRFSFTLHYYPVLLEEWKTMLPPGGAISVKDFEVDDTTTLYDLLAAATNRPRAVLMDTMQANLWKLKQSGPMTHRKVTKAIKNNMQDAYDFEEIADEIPLDAYLVRTLGDDWNSKWNETTLILFLPPPSALAPDDQADEQLSDDEGEDDIVTELYKGLDKLVKNARQGLTPSVAAKFDTIQGSSAAILDGRYRANKPATIAPPIELYHPVFSQFIRDCKSSDAIPNEHLQNTAELMRTLSGIRKTEERPDREARLLIERLVGVSLEKFPNHDRTSRDFCHITPTPLGASACDIMAEIKGEAGIGGSDPAVQVSLSIQRFWILDSRGPIREACCCPSFIIALAGPLVVILGAVLTSHMIVQRLTPYLWFGVSRILDDQQVLDLARPFYALKKALVVLQGYYATLTHIPRAPAGGPIHPRFCPYITQYPDGDGFTSFTYLRPLERHATCVTYQVKLKGKFAVVKFVRQYGNYAHELMAGNGLAPELIYYGRLGAGFRDLGMVVMGWVEGKTLFDAYGADGLLPSEVNAEVRRGLDILNANGFVFGDLRRPNIMLTHTHTDAEEKKKKKKKKIHFVDFDWAGKTGEVRYPFHLSRDIRETAGAAEYDFITREHQDALFRAL